MRTAASHIISASLTLALISGCAGTQERQVAGAMTSEPRSQAEPSQERPVDNRLSQVKANLKLEVEIWLDSLKQSGPLPWNASTGGIALRNEWPEADSLFLEALAAKLREEDSSSIRGAARDTLVVGANGSLSFRSGMSELALQASIPARPIIDRELAWSENEYIYLAAEEASPAAGAAPATQWEKRSFPRADEYQPTMGDQILYALEVGMKKAYETGNMKKLEEIYRGEGKCILSGFVTRDPTSGIDTAHYYWLTAEEYLAGLRAFYAAGKKVNLSLQTLGLYLDVSDGTVERYWAIVYQGWSGSSVGGGKRYDDGGFLFLNFDFDKSGKLVDFNIKHRLWFNNYKSPKREIQRERWERINMDIVGMLNGIDPTDGIPGRMEKGRFIPDRKAAGTNLMNKVLLERMRTDLVGLLKRSCRSCTQLQANSP